MKPINGEWANDHAHPHVSTARSSEHTTALYTVPSTVRLLLHNVTIWRPAIDRFGARDDLKQCAPTQGATDPSCQTDRDSFRL